MRSRHHGDRSRFRDAVLAVLAGIWLSACAQAPQLAPESAPVASGAAGEIASAQGVTAGGVTLEVVPDRWRYDPRDLPERVIPVHVRIVNRRAEPVLVSLTDASLLEEGSAPRIAITPGDAVQASVRDGRGVGGSRGLGIGGIGIQLGGMAVGGPGWSVGTSGVPIGGPGAGGMEGGMDALRVGIRPGRLDPGANVEGYLFFDKPLRRRDRDHRYRLTWAFRPLVPVGAPAAPPVATVEIPLAAR